MIWRAIVAGALAGLVACGGRVRPPAPQWSTIHFAAVEVRVPPRWVAIVELSKQSTHTPFLIGRGWVVWQVVLRPKGLTGGSVLLEGVRYDGVYDSARDVLQRPQKPMRFLDERMGSEILEVSVPKGEAACTIDRQPTEEYYSVMAHCVAARPGERYATHAWFGGSEQALTELGGIEMTARVAAEVHGLHPIWWKE